jgi:hypothetical protein
MVQKLPSVVETLSHLPMLRLFDESDAAARNLIEALLELRSQECDGRAALAAGATVQDAFLAGEPARVRARAALTEMSSALRRQRTESIRELVDQEGLSVSAVSRLIGHSRQLVKRLYDGGSEETLFIVKS